MASMPRFASESVRLRDAALEDAIAELHPRLIALARAMGALEPEDLVQTTMEIALRHAGQLRDPDKLWPWVASIQTREMFHWSRRLRQRIWDRQSSQQVAELETFVDLRTAIAALPPRIRASIALHYMAELTVQETADALGTSTNTVKTQIRVGLRRLKEAME